MKRVMLVLVLVLFGLGFAQEQKKYTAQDMLFLSQLAQTSTHLDKLVTVCAISCDITTFRTQYERFYNAYRELGETVIYYQERNWESDAFPRYFLLGICDWCNAIIPVMKVVQPEYYIKGCLSYDTMLMLRDLQNVGKYIDGGNNE